MSNGGLPERLLTDITTTHIVQVTYHDHNDIAHESRYIVVFETAPESGQYIAATSSYPITTEEPISR